MGYTKPEGTRTLNRVTGKFQADITKDCIFNSPTDAKDILQMMDYGYKAVKKNHYMDINNERIY